MASTAGNDKPGKMLTGIALLAGFGIVGLYLYRFQDLILLALKLLGRT